MAGEIRQNRVANAIKRFIGSHLLSEYGDTPVSTVTVNEVIMTPDLRLAKIFYSTFDKKENEAVKEILETNIKTIRFKLAKHLKSLKFVPEIKFIYDDSVERIIRLEKIFEEIKSKAE
ncbi:MAG: 30S ribosome-binding factor RbfA [bacterium]